MPRKKRVWSEKEKTWMQENLRYDPETGLLWWTKPGPKRPLKRPAGSFTTSKYVAIFSSTSTGTGKQVGYLAHHIAWFLYYNEVVDYLDHIDHDPSNNRIENLRVATHQANLLNRKPWSKSGFKGVTIRGSRWSAAIGNKDNDAGGIIHLGTFDTAEEAAAAFDRKCEEYKRRYPEFATYFVTNRDLGLI